VGDPPLELIVCGRRSPGGVPRTDDGGRRCAVHDRNGTL